MHPSLCISSPPNTPRSPAHLILTQVDRYPNSPWAGILPSCNYQTQNRQFIILQKSMHPRAHPQPQLSSDFAITRWEDSILGPKNQNLLQEGLLPLPNKLYHRKQIFAGKRKLSGKNEGQNQGEDARDKENEKLWAKLEQCELSNFDKYKQKMENIDREIVRWEEVSHKRIDKIGLYNNQFHKVRSGLLKAFTEAEEGLAKQLGRGKFLSKSIDYNRKDTARSRPMSCNQDRIQKQSLLRDKFAERSKTIHSKTRLKRSFSKKKQNNEGQFASLTINQLDSGKVKHILKCLSQRH